MKAIFLLSLVGAALAATGPVPVNAQYAAITSPASGSCVVRPGYALYALTAAPTANTAVTTSTAVSPTVWVLQSTGAAIAATTCEINVPGDADTWFVVGCAANYTAVGAGTTGQTMGKVVMGANTWDNTAGDAVAGFTSPYDFGTSTTFACVPTPIPSCNYTCTTAGTGSGCKAASGNSLVGVAPQSLCNAGYYAIVTSPASATTSCPAGGLNGTNWVVVCSNDVTTYTTTAQWFLVASSYPGWSEPKSCNCASAPSCPKKNVNSPTCSLCNLSPCVQTNAGTGTLGGVRANTFAAAAFCPAGTTTIAAMWDCFEQGACGGAIAKGDVCIFGVGGSAGTAPCPTCPSGSKKGLLGLLGLLGLIPLLLCSSLLCLLLFCIRRNKKERDVHFATFDAGAPQVVAPVCHDFPVAHQTQTVHHATYVGPQHCAVPSGFGY